MLAMAEYIDVEDLVHKRSSVARSLTALTQQVQAWQHDSNTDSNTDGNTHGNTHGTASAKHKTKKKKSKGTVHVAQKQKTPDDKKDSTLQSYQWLVENLITTITTLDRAMMDTFRTARVSSWELLHLQKKSDSHARLEKGLCYKK